MNQIPKALAFVRIISSIGIHKNYHTKSQKDRPIHKDCISRISIYKYCHTKYQKDWHSQGLTFTQILSRITIHKRIISRNKQSAMGNLCKRERKLSRKELTSNKIEEEKEKTRQRSYNPRH